MMTFRDFIFKAFKELKCKYTVLESYSLPKDFRVSDKFQEGNYLKVVFIRKLN
jgi:23S rRNA (cytosine1962-C5)-methyltransferase